jgi:type 2 lantibiotic biosynthesis protein LanM
MSTQVKSADTSWVRALWLDERLSPPEIAREREARSGDEAVGRWARRSFGRRTALLERRLLHEQIDRPTLEHLLAEDSELLRQRKPDVPVWWQRSEDAWESQSSHPGVLGSRFGGSAPIIWRVGATAEPMLRAPLAELRTRLDAIARHYPLPVSKLMDDLTPQLVDAAGSLVLPTFVLELNAARLRGTLEGDGPAARFDMFLHALRTGRWLTLMREYPVLARKLVERSDRWVAATVDCLARFADDAAELAAHNLIDGIDDHPVSLSPPLGDAHRGRLGVRAVRTASGRRVVYKPRTLSTDCWFQRTLQWLNERGIAVPFPLLEVISKDTYGWQEYVERRYCQTDAELQRFYRRQGGYVALILAVNGTDIHHENVIGCGEYPYIVDVETLCQPVMINRSRPFAEGRSVLSSGLLPAQRLVGGATTQFTDLSALGASPQAIRVSAFVPLNAGTDEMAIGQEYRPLGKVDSTPCADSRPAIGRHAGDLMNGFTEVYETLASSRPFPFVNGGVLEPAVDQPVRVILRATRNYEEILRSSVHPSALTDALEAEAVLDRLWPAVEQVASLERVIKSEKDDIRDQDVPYFVTFPRSRCVWDSRGRPVEGLVTRSPLEALTDTGNEMGPRQLARERWFIEASLATVGDIHRGRRCGLDPEAPDRTDQQLLAIAKQAGEWLLTLSRDAEGRETAWYRIRREGDVFSLEQGDLGLYDGASGIALFLAYLGQTTGERRFSDKAAWIASEVERCVYAGMHIADGLGISGIGGVVYSLTHLAVLLGVERGLPTAVRLAHAAAPLVSSDRAYDLIAGAAGWILCVAPLYERCPDDVLRQSLLAAGERLIERATELVLSAAAAADPPLAGYAHGAAGLADALAWLFEMSGDTRFSHAARVCVEYERALFSPERGNWPDLRRTEETHTAYMTAWCHGAPGIALGRLRFHQASRDARCLAEIAAATATTLRDGFGENHCLCHGDLGNLDCLIEVSRYLGDDDLWRQVRRLASRISASIDEVGFRSGVPVLQPIPMPGLFIGVAGSGLALLRVVSPQVPCVLRLAPPASHGRGA